MEDEEWKDGNSGLSVFERVWVEQNVTVNPLAVNTQRCIQVCDVKISVNVCV